MMQLGRSPLLFPHARHPQQPRSLPSQDLKTLRTTKPHGRGSSLTARSTSLYLRDGEESWCSWRSELFGRGKMLGTVSVHLTEARTGAAEESYFEMVSTFASSQACPNVSSVDLSAPHQALDARFLRVLGEHRPLIKTLNITAWSYLPLEEGESKWRGFEQLQTVNIKLADGKDFPNCFDDLLKGLPKTVKNLHIENTGPHYGSLDTRLVRHMPKFWLRGLTLQHHFGFRESWRKYVMDCKYGSFF